MSAHDDLLAAFGAPPTKQPAEVVEATDAAETPQVDAAAEVDAQAEADTVIVERADAEGEAAVAGAEAEVETAAVSAEAIKHEQAPESVGGEAEFAAAPEPYLDPAAFFAQLQAESAPQPNRRWPRLLLRYASALALAGALGVGTAYIIALPKRTDVPFLATPSDGRHTFPAMVRPAPPAGEPAPGDAANQSQIHYGDLRQYLLSAPVGAVAKEDGWEPVADFESSLTGTEIPGHLADKGLRHVARRSWTTLDGQHTVVELLQFPDHQAAFDVRDKLDTAAPKKAGRERNVVPLLTVPSFGDTTFIVALHTFDEVEGLPGQKERRVVFGSGDVIAIVTTTAPAKVLDVPTEQVVLLEAQMLR